MPNFLAFDLGAESGRAILGKLTAGRLELEQLHRFPNTPVRLPTGMYWDTLRLFHEIGEGLSAAGRGRGLQIDGIGIDTWGVDFALLGRDGALVDNPRHYRDARNNGIVERMCGLVPRAEIFRQTGIQFMQINSLCQLVAARLENSPSLDTAETLLFMPDLFHYYLTGVKRAELTIASTSQFYNPVERRWATELFDRFGLSSRILPEIISPGTRLGTLLPHVADAAGVGSIPVYATAAHDTAAAVAAVPADGDGWCYISSGTWSLMGVEIDAPLVGEKALELNFTNEMGAEGKVRLLKNIAGLWVLQECRRAWARAGAEYSYEQLAQMASDAPPFVAAIDPDAFLEPGHMPERIAEFCRKSGQQIPEQPGAMCRVVLESLALRYRQVVENLETLTERPIRVIHIVGGGSKNRLLNQLAADATGRHVVAGPVEATAAGNVLVQAMGAGELRALKEAREVVRQSFELETFEPSGADWSDAWRRYRHVVNAGN